MHHESYRNFQCAKCKKKHLVLTRFSMDGTSYHLNREKLWKQIKRCPDCDPWFNKFKNTGLTFMHVTRKGLCDECREFILPKGQWNPTRSFGCEVINDEKLNDYYIFFNENALLHYNNKLCADHNVNRRSILKTMFKKRDQSKKARRGILLNKIEKHLDEFNSTMAEIEASPEVYLIGDFLPLTALTEIERLSVTRCGKPFRGKKVPKMRLPVDSSGHLPEGT